VLVLDTQLVDETDIAPSDSALSRQILPRLACLSVIYGGRITATPGALKKAIQRDAPWVPYTAKFRLRNTSNLKLLASERNQPLVAQVTLWRHARTEFVRSLPIPVPATVTPAVPTGSDTG
jgi:hypothetical protein